MDREKCIRGIAETVIIAAVILFTPKELGRDDQRHNIDHIRHDGKVLVMHAAPQIRRV